MALVATFQQEGREAHLTRQVRQVYPTLTRTPPTIALTSASFGQPLLPRNTKQPIQGAVGKQPITKEDMMQVFRKASRLGTEETKFYLESSGWDLSKALAEWRAEIRWEAEQVRGRTWESCRSSSCCLLVAVAMVIRQRRCFVDIRKP